MGKSLKVLNSNFFDLFFECQRRALLTFSTETKELRNLGICKTDKTEEYYIRTIVQKIIISVLLYIKEYKKINYTKFVLISKSILKDFLNIKENDYLEKEYKLKSKTTNKQILLAKIEDNLKIIFNVIKQEDSLEITNGNIEDLIEINYYVKERIDTKFKFGTCMQFQNKYFYKVEIPLISLTDTNELNVIYFINDINYFNPPNTSIELALVTFYLNEKFSDYQLKNFILYDTTNFKRHVFPINSLNEISVLDELFKILVLLEYKNVTKSRGKRCSKCLNSALCTLETMTQDKHTEFHKTIRQRYGNISSFKTNDLVKKKLLFEKSLESFNE